MYEVSSINAVVGNDILTIVKEEQGIHVVTFKEGVLTKTLKE